MKILVLDASKLDIQFAVYDQDTLSKHAYGRVENIGIPHGRITVYVRRGGKVEKHVEIIDLYDVSLSVHKIIRMLQEQYIEVISSAREISAVGHRVTHGGEFFPGPTVVNRDVTKQIKNLIPYAPEHNKYDLACIKISQRIMPNALHITFFDTSFQLTMAARAFKYALPDKYYEKYRLRKYGSHGLTHQCLLQQASEILEKPASDLNVISINFEKECSIAAIKKGKCIDTSSGLSPFSGISVNGQLADMDPAVVDYLIRYAGVKAKDLSELLGKDTGLATRYGDNKLEKLLDKPEDSFEKQLRIEMLAFQIKKIIGSFMFTLGQVDALLFTPGPENTHFLRQKILEDLEIFGIALSEEKNLQDYSNYYFIQSDRSKMDIMVINPDEETFMADTIKSALMEAATA